MDPTRPAVRDDDSPEGTGSSGGARARALVVDDNVDAADTFGLLLETLGCDVRTAYTGNAAVEAWREFTPHLVFLDLGLPDLSGLDVCERLRATPGGSGVVICAVTGWGRAADREASARAGFDHHLVKPVEPERITPLVAAIATRLRAAAEVGSPSAS